MAGDFILAVASMMIARLRSDEVTLVLSQVLIYIYNIIFLRANVQRRFYVELSKMSVENTNLNVNFLQNVPISK